MIVILEDVVFVADCQIYLTNTEFPISVHIFHPEYGRYSPLAGKRTSLFDQENFSKYVTHMGSYHIGRLNISQKTCYVIMSVLTGRHRSSYVTKKG